MRNRVSEQRSKSTVFAIRISIEYMCTVLYYICISPQLSLASMLSSKAFRHISQDRTAIAPRIETSALAAAC